MWREIRYGIKFKQAVPNLIESNIGVRSNLACLLNQAALDAYKNLHKLLRNDRTKAYLLR